MAAWLIKSEPTAFSIDDLAAAPGQTTCWDGVRNYQARNMMRDQMKRGDRVFFYHSNCEEPGIAGTAVVVKEGYPDHTAFDPADRHFDPRSHVDRPRWYMVDIRLQRKLSRTIPLRELRDYADGPLSDFALLRKGNRLSVMPVSDEQWAFITGLENDKT